MRQDAVAQAGGCQCVDQRSEPGEVNSARVAASCYQFARTCAGCCTARCMRWQPVCSSRGSPSIQGAPIHLPV
eukprot:364078-Chlamydomonas_euryale.AAC.5